MRAGVEGLDATGGTPVRFIATAITVAVVLTATSALGQVVKPVEVVNPAMPTPPMRWQLVGFTAATYLGDMGSHFGVTAKCQLEFAVSRMCTLEEVAATTAIPAGLSGSAWVHPRAILVNVTSGVIFDANILADSAGNCRGWKSSTVRGWQVGSDGLLVPDTANSVGHPCEIPAAIACCARVP